MDKPIAKMTKSEKQEEAYRILNMLAKNQFAWPAIQKPALKKRYAELLA